MFTQVNKGENPAPASLRTRQVRTMFTQVNKGENPAPASIDDDGVEVICGGRPVHTET